MSRPKGNGGVAKPKHPGAKTGTNRSLKRLRTRIDRADRALLEALSARFRAVLEVGELKRELGLPVVQKNRWLELMEDRLRQANRLELSKDFIQAVFKLIHKEAIRLQSRKK